VVNVSLVFCVTGWFETVFMAAAVSDKILRKSTGEGFGVPAREKCQQSPEGEKVNQQAAHLPHY
jgi:hypothetical protein